MENGIETASSLDPSVSGDLFGDGRQLCRLCNRMVKINNNGTMRRHKRVPGGAACRAFNQNGGNENLTRVDRNPFLQMSQSSSNNEEIGIDRLFNIYSAENQLGEEDEIPNSILRDHSSDSRKPLMIHHKPKQEREIRVWAREMVDLLNEIGVGMRNDDTTTEWINGKVNLMYDNRHPLMREEIRDYKDIGREEDIVLTGFTEEFLSEEPREIPRRSDPHSILTRAMRFGNISKARDSMRAGGIGDIESDSVRRNILEKYPSGREPVDFPDLYESGIQFDDEAIVNVVLDYICRFKRGSSPSLIGFSMDHIQDLLYYQEEGAIKGLMNLVELIIGGKVSSVARKRMLHGRGVPILGEDNIKIRPINIDCPFHKIASHLLSFKCKEKAVEICGDFQLGNAIKGGTEVAVHTIRILLELNPSWVIIKTDMKNAFNSIPHNVVMRAVAEKLPEASTYTAFIFQEPVSVIYRDNKKKLSMEVVMERGVCQGNPMSTINFNISQTDALQRVRHGNPHVVIISVHDDHYILGEVEHVFPALQSFDVELNGIGLYRNIGKSALYKQESLELEEDAEEEVRRKCEEYSCGFVEGGEGIIVVGSPVGSKRFMSNFVMKVVEDKIQGELDKLDRVLRTPDGTVKKDLQTIYQIVRLCIPAQLTYLLRTCNPRDTEGAALLLDEKLEKYILKIFNSEKYSNGMENGLLGDLYNRIHLKISKGGLGITPSAAISGGAYLGSMALSLGWIKKLIPNLLERLQESGDMKIPAIASLERHMAIAKELCPKSLAGLSLEAMVNQQMSQVQKLVSASIHEDIAATLDRNLRQVVAGGGDLWRANLPISDKERALQHIINKDPVNYAFLTANPCAPLCAMSNEGFTVAVQHRLLLPIGDTRKFCLCGADVGDFLSHVTRCPVMKVRNQVRNAMHKELKFKVGDIIQHRIKLGGVDRRIVGPAEPNLSDYFERTAYAPPEMVLNSQEGDTQQRYQVKVRGDMAVYHQDENKSVVVDFTFIEPTTDQIRKYDKPGEAAEVATKRKLEEYKYWDYTNSSNSLIIFSVETFGVVSKGAMEYLRSFIVGRENGGIIKQTINQQLSVALHTMRAKAFVKMKTMLTMDVAPSVPMVNGNNVYIRVMNGFPLDRVV
jgi:hypothetical protein